MPAIHTLIFPQHDLEKGVSFYELLGARCTLFQESGWAELIISNVKIALCKIDEPMTRFTGAVFALQQLDSCSAKLKKAGYTVSEQTSTALGPVVSVTDPGGNILELIKAAPIVGQEEIIGGCCG